MCKRGCGPVRVRRSKYPSTELLLLLCQSLQWFLLFRKLKSPLCHGLHTRQCRRQTNRPCKYLFETIHVLACRPGLHATRQVHPFLTQSLHFGQDFTPVSSVWPQKMSCSILSHEGPREITSNNLTSRTVLCPLQSSM